MTSANDPAIAVRSVSKRYEIYGSPRARLLDALWPGRAHAAAEVWALRDVDLEVGRGESVAIIGRNGGGKSTLLQIIAGVVQPTSGEARVSGRVCALLELGSGFNPEYTGRDNVMLNGLLLGLTRAEVAERFGEIEAFAEIGAAIDRPVKTYSSGMVMRLAFAVQVLARPEILIVDEALSVGDFFFQQKCFAHIRSLAARGVTLLFVSHDMGTVRDLCPRALYLREGCVQYFGPTHIAVSRYLAERAGSASAASAAGASAADSVPRAIPPEALWRRDDPCDGRPLRAVEVTTLDGRSTTSIRMGSVLCVRVHVRPDGVAGHLSLVIKNRYDQVVTSTSTLALGLRPVDGEAAIVRFDATMALEAGLYAIMVAYGPATTGNRGQVLDETGWLGPVRVEWDYEHDTAPFLGMFGLPVRAALADEATATEGIGP